MERKRTNTIHTSSRSRLRSDSSSNISSKTWQTNETVKRKGNTNTKKNPPNVNRNINRRIRTSADSVSTSNSTVGRGKIPSPPKLRRHRDRTTATVTAMSRPNDNGNSNGNGNGKSFVPSSSSVASNSNSTSNSTSNSSRHSHSTASQRLREAGTKSVQKKVAVAARSSPTASVNIRKSHSLPRSSNTMKGYHKVSTRNESQRSTNTNINTNTNTSHSKTPLRRNSRSTSTSTSTSTAKQPLKQKSNHNPQHVKQIHQNRKSDGIGQGKHKQSPPPVQTIHLSTSMEEEDTTNKERSTDDNDNNDTPHHSYHEQSWNNQINDTNSKSKLTNAIHTNKVETMNKEQTQEEQQRQQQSPQQQRQSPQPYIPKHNLHLNLQNCAWAKLYHQLKELSTTAASRMHIQAEMTVRSMDDADATVLHTACWKAPAGLALIMIKLLPIQGAIDGDDGNNNNNDHGQDSNIFLTQDKDGNTPLHLLCANLAPYFDDNSSQPILDISVLELLLQNAPEALNIRNNQGDTPLHLFVTSPAATASTVLSSPPPPVATVLRGLKMIYDYVSKSHSPPEKSLFLAKDHQGATPFHSAIACRADESILMALLEYSPTVVKIGDVNGLLPLHYVAAFLQTSEAVVTRMLQLYQYGLCHKTIHGDTPLHILVRNSAEDVVLNDETNTNDRMKKTKLLNRNAIHLLEVFMGNSEEIILPSTATPTGQGDKNLNEEYDPFFITNKQCLTPLHACALFNASVQVTQILVGHSSAHRAALSTNSFGATPLHLAAAHPNVSVDITMLVGNANTDAAVVRDKRYMTPLHVAVQNKNATTDLMECIVELNPKACEIADNRGNVPIHLAIQSEAEDHIVETLLRLYPEKKNFRNKLLDTPLHYAVMNNTISLNIMSLLVDQYDEALNSQNSRGDVPLHCAASSEILQPDVIELLLTAYPESASIQNNNGDCPLHAIVTHTSVSIQILSLFMDVAKTSICVLNKSNETPLDKAKEKASYEIVKLLDVWFEEQSVENP